MNNGKQPTDQTRAGVHVANELKCARTGKPEDFFGAPTTA